MSTYVLEIKNGKIINPSEEIFEKLSDYETERVTDECWESSVSGDVRNLTVYYMA